MHLLVWLQPHIIDEQRYATALHCGKEAMMHHAHDDVAYVYDIDDGARMLHAHHH